MAANCESLSKLTVGELKSILKRKGLGVGKRSKKELIEAVGDLQHIYSDLEQCDHLESEVKRRKVQDKGGKWVDLNASKVTWKSDLSSLPDVREGDAFAYFVTACDWSPHKLTNYKSQDGYKMYKDQHVEGLEIGHLGDKDGAGFMYVRGKVRPEQRQSAQRYNTWLLLTTSGEVKSGGCECVAADDGSCKHVVCLLFSVADFNNRRSDSGTEVGTDRACYWTKARQESKPVNVVNLDYRHNKDGPRKLGPIPENFRPAPVKEESILGIRENIQRLCQRVKPGALFLTATDPPPKPPSISTIPQLAVYYKSQVDGEDFLSFLKDSVTEDQKEYLKHLSQEDPAWNHARKGRITASVAKDVLTLKNTSSAKTLIGRVMQTKVASHPNLDHGKKFEPVARQMYHDKEGKNHKGMTVTETGLHICGDHPFLGGSPDGLVFCKCHGDRILEIKCSVKHENVFVNDIPKIDPTYHLEVIAGKLSLKHKSPWYSQVQFQMGVTGTHQCDLVVHTRKGIEPIPVPWDEQHWQTLSKKAVQVFKRRILPILFDEE